MKKFFHHTKRTTIALVGATVVLLGLVLIPYPGPGWLVVFGGFAILATEFEWAQRLLHRMRGHYDDWQVWLARQPIWIRAVFITATALVVLTTLWLLNGYGMISDFFGLGLDGLRSPLPFFYN